MEKLTFETRGMSSFEVPPASTTTWKSIPPNPTTPQRERERDLARQGFSGGGAGILLSGFVLPFRRLVVAVPVL